MQLICLNTSCYNNDKLWLTARLRQLRQKLRSRVGTESKFGKVVTEAKQLYSEKLQQKFSANYFVSVWKGLRQISNCKC